MKDRHLLRVALHLRAVLEARAAGRADRALMQRLAGYHQALDRLRTALRQSAGAVDPSAAWTLRRQLLGLVQAVRMAADQSRAQWQYLPTTIPTVRELLADLRQLQAEFVGFDFHLAEKTLSVITEPIELEGVYLGPFTIRLHWGRLAGDGNDLGFKVIALEPRPASTNERITHPHVKDEMLCTGEAGPALHLAVTQGRLADAFLVIRSVLAQYNPRSPYVALEAWEGEPCHECNGLTATDHLSYCENCGYDFCDDCTQRCAACSELRCQSCLEPCPRCDASVCASCLINGPAGSGRCCPGCAEAVVDDEAVVAATDEPTPESVAPVNPALPPSSPFSESVHEPVPASALPF